MIRPASSRSTTTARPARSMWSATSPPPSSGPSRSHEPPTRAAAGAGPNAAQARQGRSGVPAPRTSLPKPAKRPRGRREKLSLFLASFGFGLVTAAVLAIAAVGFTMQFAVTDVLNLAYGAVMIASAFVAYAVNQAGASVWLGLVAAAGGGGGPL